MGGQWSRDFDENAVAALVSGRAVAGARMADYWEAIRRLHRLQYSDGQIAHALNRRRRSVMRTRIALGLPPVIPRHDRFRKAGELMTSAPTRPWWMK